MTKATPAEFLSIVGRLEDSELAGAYKALADINAPMICLDILLERMVDSLGLAQAEQIVDSIAFEA